jgi:hypothetical protein
MANVNTTISVVGVKEALAYLNGVDKTYRREITRQYAAIVEPIVKDAQSHLPSSAPMSGWKRNYSVGGQQKAAAKGQTSRLVGRGTQRDNFSRAAPDPTDLLPWDGAKQAKLIKPWVSGKKSKANTFGLKWNSKSAALSDLSGRAKTPQGEQMITVLGARFGGPSRVMWKSYERADDQLQANMRKLIEEIMASVNRNMKVI